LLLKNNVNYRKIKLVGFEAFIAVVMKSSTFRDITPCSLLKVNGHFGGTFCLHRQGRRISQERNQHEAGSKQSLIFNGLHGIMSQKVELFKEILIAAFPPN
jgi:hypothetical protein